MRVQVASNTGHTVCALLCARAAAVNIHLPGHSRVCCTQPRCASSDTPESLLALAARDKARRAASRCCSWRAADMNLLDVDLPVVLWAGWPCQISMPICPASILLEAAAPASSYHGGNLLSLSMTQKFLEKNNCFCAFIAAKEVYDTDTADLHLVLRLILTGTILDASSGSC